MPIRYKIFRDDIQLVEIELDPGETVIAEAGAMVYMDTAKFGCNPCRSVS
ncbi:MAG: AIM24 family protein [Bacteroidales bacterium]|nr:AIM24 family protein [Bacteroidales bacterium]